MLNADTLSSSQVRLTGIAGLLPLFMQQTMLAGALANQTGSGATSGSSGSKGSKVEAKTSSTQQTTTAVPESSRSSENNQLVQTLLAKMFGEDEDEDLKGLRTELTRERLRMELQRQRMEHRAEMRKLQAQRRAEDLARREQDRVRGQAHRERKMRNGPGVPISAAQREYMEKGIRRDEAKLEEARARGRAKFEESL